MMYCQPVDVARFLGLQGLDDDEMIDGMIAAASSAIDAYCHRTFAAVEDETRYYDAIGEHIRGLALFLRQGDELAEITEIINGDGQEIPADAYVTAPRNLPPFWGIRIKNQAGLRWTYDLDWEGAIAITGKWAYSVTPPPAVKQAAIAYAAFMYRQKDQPFTDVTAIEAGVVMQPVGIPAHVKQLLRGFVKP